MCKRFFDIVLSFAGLIFLSPILVILMVWVKCDSEGPALFVQTRLGRRQRPFKIYKFRTMPLGTPETLTHLAAPASVTRAGLFLRRTKLDELPQLYNVLKGEMSLVGPRPGLLTDVSLTEARERRSVFSVRPGITGLAKIKGIDMSDPEHLALVDAEYVAQMSIFRDLMIVRRTFQPADPIGLLGASVNFGTDSHVITQRAA